ncbi:MAG: multicopper oxidase domain-containing protein [Bdellovibrionota bacterium]
MTRIVSIFLAGLLVGIVLIVRLPALPEAVSAVAEQVQPADFVPVTVPGVPDLPYEMDGEVKVFNLTAEKVIRKFRDPSDPKGGTREIVTWGYNGSMPGPTIQVMEGDHVRIHFTNNWTMPTTVHWHGIELPNNMDGGSSMTQALVQPGGSYTYEFTLHQNAGTYMYHSGHMQAYQVGMGSSGFFIIHPKASRLPKVDKDFAFMLQIWSVPPHGNVPNTASMSFNYFTMNGMTGPDIPHMMVKQGERVRIRLGNLSMMSHPIHIHGFTFDVTDMGGGFLPPHLRWPANTMSVNAGENRAVELTAHTPGKWMFHCHFLHHIMNDMEFLPIPGQPHQMSHGEGMFTMLHVVEK